MARSLHRSSCRHTGREISECLGCLAEEAADALVILGAYAHKQTNTGRLLNAAETATYLDEAVLLIMRYQELMIRQNEVRS